MIVRRLHGWMYLSLCSAVLLAGCPAASDVPGGTGGTIASMTVQGVQPGNRECRKPANADALVDRVLELVNLERTQRGLDPVMLNPILCKMADDFACDMIENNFFDHVNLSGKGPGQRALDAGYVFLAIGENLAGGQTSPEQVMSEWMASAQGHRENILQAQWREIGIAVRTGGQLGVYWVQEFGNPP